MFKSANVRCCYFADRAHLFSLYKSSCFFFFFFFFFFDRKKSLWVSYIWWCYFVKYSVIILENKSLTKKHLNKTVYYEYDKKREIIFHISELSISVSFSFNRQAALWTFITFCKSVRIMFSQIFKKIKKEKIEIKKFSSNYSVVI